MDPGNADGFTIVRPDDPEATAAWQEWMAGLRDRIGDEAVARMQRSDELSRRPVPLTDAHRAVLRDAVAPVLRDLKATAHVLPDIREEAHHDRGQDAVCAWIQGPGGTGQGIDVCLNGPPGFQLCSLAEQLQSWKADQLLDSGQGPWWPRCPQHPVDCRLGPDIVDEIAVWSCPRSGQVIATIGSLRHTDPSVAAKFDKKARRERRRSDRAHRAGQAGTRTARRSPEGAAGAHQ
jgi:hypothetical protein